ncbi:DUF541 domain-containing protein [Nakamurella sp. YIM 132087]|uniref:DUF541 domain-containing protein n=1 Tax=Nakamurella alba TaxID=2665158 RepID=A0A7K1FTR5_9ACTN|nr:SIMPL domain-containing protein [Nakamurella alba]MTD17470.1 DUF541 domain-containing protein [Nakamurella alba]
MESSDNVTVIGSGSAAAAVDRVVVNLSVTERGRDAGTAFEAAAHTATRALAVLADDGADARSVRTSDLTLGPQVDYRDGREVVLGYQATQRLVLQLNGLSRLSRMLTDLATQVGNGVRIDGMQLVPSDPAAALAEARDAAMADARTKAEHYARLAGRELGRVRSVSESVQRGQAPVAMGLGFKREAMAMPIATGDAAITATVEVVWELLG